MHGKHEILPSFQHIKIEGRLDMQKSAECGQAFRWRRKGDYYSCVIGGHLLSVRREGDGIDFTVGPGLSRAEGRRLITSYLRLDDDFSGIMRSISRDRIIGEALKRNIGLRLFRQDPWECLVSYLLSINSNIPRLSRDVERIAAAFGRRKEWRGELFYTFPDVEALSEVTEQDLRKMGIGFRARYISETARLVKDGGIDISSLRRMGYEDGRETLLSLPGIGPKVADCILLFSLDKLEAFPVDRWVRRCVEDLYFGGAHMTERRIREWAGEYFGAYAGYAQQLLFHTYRTRQLSICRSGVA